MKTGKVTENVLKRSVLRQVEKGRKEILTGAGVGEDCAILHPLSVVLYPVCRRALPERVTIPG